MKKSVLLVMVILLSISLYGTHCHAIEVYKVGPVYLGFDAIFPDLFIDVHGNLHVTYLHTSGVDVGYRKYLTSMWDENPATLRFDQSIPALIPEAIGNGHYGMPRVAATSQGLPAVVYAPFLGPGHGVGPVYCQVYDGRSWSSRSVATASFPYSVQNPTFPDISIHPHNDVMYVIASQLYPSWDSQILGLVTANFSTSPAWSSHTTLEYMSRVNSGNTDFDAYGNFHVVWNQTGNYCSTVAYRMQRADGTWEQPEICIQQDDCFIRAFVEIDPLGNPWISYSGYQYAGHDPYLENVKLITKRNGQWIHFSPADNGYNPGLHFEAYPGLATTNNGTIMMWYDSVNRDLHNTDFRGRMRYMATDGAEMEEGYIGNEFRAFWEEPEFSRDNPGMDGRGDVAYAIYREGDKGLVLWKFYMTQPPMQEITLNVPSHCYPYDQFFVNVDIPNEESWPLSSYYLLVVLSAYGHTYFAPSFSEFDLYSFDMADIASKNVTVVPTILWPDDVGSGSVDWIAGMTNGSFSKVMSNIEIRPFSWDPSPPTATPTLTPVPTETPTQTPIPTDTPIPTNTPIPPTETPTETPTEIPTETPTETPTEIPTETPTETPVPTDTPYPSETPTGSPIPTDTPIPPTETPTESPYPTETPTPTPNEMPGW